MRVRSHLLMLPVHRQSYDDYYRAHDTKTQSLKKQVEQDWQGPFAELPAHVQLVWQDRWYWPPWFFNDLVGYVRIASEQESHVSGTLFLQRSCFSPTAPERFSRGDEDSHEIVLFSRTGNRGVNETDNASWIEAIESLVLEAEETIHQQAADLPGAVVCRPDHDLSCFDFVEAASQLRQRVDSSEPD